ncbi:MAG: hypothetical protein K2W99_02880 [Chthoniobacterales bacterium]|nr:hypothetical protein [Chthoniobacterales bacterium]
MITGPSQDQTNNLVPLTSELNVSPKETDPSKDAVPTVTSVECKGSQLSTSSKHQIPNFASSVGIDDPEIDPGKIAAVPSSKIENVSFLVPRKLLEDIEELSHQIKCDQQQLDLLKTLQSQQQKLTKQVNTERPWESTSITDAISCREQLIKNKEAELALLEKVKDGLEDEEGSSFFNVLTTDEENVLRESSDKRGQLLKRNINRISEWGVKALEAFNTNENAPAKRNIFKFFYEVSQNKKQSLSEKELIKLLEALELCQQAAMMQDASQLDLFSEKQHREINELSELYNKAGETCFSIFQEIGKPSPNEKRIALLGETKNTYRQLVHFRNDYCQTEFQVSLLEQTAWICAALKDSDQLSEETIKDLGTAKNLYLEAMEELGKKSNKTLAELLNNQATFLLKAQKAKPFPVSLQTFRTTKLGAKEIKLSSSTNLPPSSSGILNEYKKCSVLFGLTVSAYRKNDSRYEQYRKQAYDLVKQLQGIEN